VFTLVSAGVRVVEVSVVPVVNPSTSLPVVSATYTNRDVGSAAVSEGASVLVVRLNGLPVRAVRAPVDGIAEKPPNTNALGLLGNTKVPVMSALRKVLPVNPPVGEPDPAVRTPVALAAV
jgi:hypothetical protein